MWFTWMPILKHRLWHMALANSAPFLSFRFTFYSFPKKNMSQICDGSLEPPAFRRLQLQSCCLHSMNIMWFDPVLYVMVVPMLAAHALMGISIRNPLFSSDRLCMTINYNYLTWPTSVFVHECGLNLADTVMQRSMFHFGHCRHCYSGALLSGSGH